MEHVDEFDIISEIKFINEGKSIRATQLRKKQPFYIEVDLFDCICQMRKAEKFEDKSVFRFGLTYAQYHESLNKFINA